MNDNFDDDFSREEELFRAAFDRHAHDLDEPLHLSAAHQERVASKARHGRGAVGFLAVAAAAAVVAGGVGIARMMPDQRTADPAGAGATASHSTPSPTPVVSVSSEVPTPDPERQTPSPAPGSVTPVAPSSAQTPPFELGAYTEPGLSPLPDGTVFVSGSLHCGVVGGVAGCQSTKRVTNLPQCSSPDSNAPLISMDASKGARAECTTQGIYVQPDAPTWKAHSVHRIGDFHVYLVKSGQVYFRGAAGSFYASEQGFVPAQ